MTKVLKALITLTIPTVAFLASCDSDEVKVLLFEETGLHGDNILFPTKTEFGSRENSMQCNLADDQKLKIKITGKTATAAELIPHGIWYYDPGTRNNWAITNMDMTTYTQTFTSIDGGQTCDVKMMFDPGTFLIEYFENGAEAPTTTKTITVNY